MLVAIVTSVAEENGDALVVVGIQAVNPLLGKKKTTKKQAMTYIVRESSNSIPNIVKAKVRANSAIFFFFLLWPQVLPRAPIIIYLFKFFFSYLVYNFFFFFFFWLIHAYQFWFICVLHFIIFG